MYECIDNIVFYEQIMNNYFEILWCSLFDLYYIYIYALHHSKYEDEIIHFWAGTIIWRLGQKWLNPHLFRFFVLGLIYFIVIFQGEFYRNLIPKKYSSKLQSFKTTGKIKQKVLVCFFYTKDLNSDPCRCQFQLLIREFYLYNKTKEI